MKFVGEAKDIKERIANKEEGLEEIKDEYSSSKEEEETTESSD